MSELTTGSVIRLKNGKTCRVKKELGRGGQGIVYVADYQGKDCALKWYISPKIINSDTFYDNLNRNINAGAPAPNFVWPLAITEKQNGSYGYIMELRPTGYEDMSKFILCQAVFSSPMAQINACLQISMAFQRLHIRGLSYQDMNDGNFFINPKTGDVLICDNDNVAPDGTNMGIMGKAGYMAPEIVEGDTMPNKYTDYYSLAVCLFILIYMNRPFEGAHYLSCPCDNNPKMAKKLFGYESVFIMDPDDPSNRPVKGVHKNVLKRWSMYPKLLSNAFSKTFSKDAIRNPTQRLMDRQWHNILLQVRSNLVSCPLCGKDTFVDSSAANNTCIYCQKPITKFNRLSVGRYSIPLVPYQTVYDCQVTNRSDYLQKAGDVVLKNGHLGVINTSSYHWTVILNDGNVRLVSPGGGMPVKSGLKIKFGNQGETGEII